MEPVIHTTPESVDLQRLLARMRDAGDTACAMEVSSHALAQRRVAGMRFAAALFTNLTRDHLDYHPDVEEYYLAKRALFMRPADEGADPPGAANLDDEFGRRLAAESGALGFAVERDADVHPVGRAPVAHGLHGAHARPLAGSSRSRARCGGASTSPTSRAWSPSGSCWASTTTPWPAASPPWPGCPAGSSRSTPGSRSRCSSTTRTRPTRSTTSCARRRKLVPDGRRLIVVFGCGGDRDRGKRPQMGGIARGLADIAIVTSDNPRTEDPDAIIAEILVGAAEGPG